MPIEPSEIERPMTGDDWYEFPFHLRLHLPGRDFEGDFRIIAREVEHVRVIGTMLAYLYRRALAG